MRWKLQGLKEEGSQFTENVHAEFFVLSLEITQMAHGYKNSPTKITENHESRHKAMKSQTHY